MPTYEYRCPDGHTSEKVQSIHDELPESIPCRVSGWGTCKLQARRVFSAPAAFIFKGGGFYATDYKGRYDRTRRPNPGDSLPLPAEAVIGKSEGAEYDPPKNLPATVNRAA